jgi:hypothetical protein
MKNLLMTFSVLLAACSLAGTGPRFAFEGMTECFAPDGENFVFDSSRAKDCGAFRYGVVRALNAYDGDVRVSATFEVGALDQWNGFWLGLMPANGGRWRAVAGRQNGAPGDSRLTIRAGEEASKVERATNAVCSAVVTLAIAREKGRVSVAVLEKGAERRLERFEEAYEGPLSVVMRFDSAAATRARVTLRDFQVSAGTTYESALSPSYGVEEDFGPCVYLGGSGGARGADGTLELRKGDRALFAIQAPVTVRDWSLRWKSSGHLAVRSIVLGSAESMQLSDNVVWDDVVAKIPEGFAPRCMGLGPWITRFASDVGWRYPYATTSGLHFFEVFPTTDEPVRIGDVHLFGARALAPSPLAAPSRKVDPSALPLTLSPALPSVEIAIGTKAGAFEITHVAGRQPPSADSTLAGWLIVYEDGTTEPAFATLRWNCGVYLASSETDSVNGGAFFRRFGVADVKSLERKGKAVRYSEVPFGAGRLVIFHGTWAHGWELGRPDDVREEFLALLTRLGGFTPHVRSSVKNVAVTPYRAKDGAVLVSTINTACLEHDVRVGVSKELFKRRPSVRDLGTGLDLKVVDDGRYWSVDTTVPAINTTVLRFCE